MAPAPAAAELEALFSAAAEQVCPAQATLARSTVQRQSGEKNPEFVCTAAAKLFWIAFRKNPGEDAADGEKRAIIRSDFGVERAVTRRELATLLIEAVPQPAAARLLAFVAIADGTAGTILASTVAFAKDRAAAGLVGCSVCGKFVSSGTQGMEWHMKTAHLKENQDWQTKHAIAHGAAESAHRALVAYRGDLSSGRGQEQTTSTALSPEDMTLAQQDPQAAAVLVQQGRIKSLGEGLNACRSGDLVTLRRLVHSKAWDPMTDRDRHGSGPLLWAAGGGHLKCCQFLVNECGVPTSAVQEGRRGYAGRSALHWAARNGAAAVVHWLVETCGDSPDTLSNDGTTPFCLAAWQGHLDVCRYLVSRGAVPTRVNSYGCNAAMWAAQGPNTCVETFEYLHGELGVDVEAVNDNGQGCLHKAAQRGNAAVCRWLLEGAGIRGSAHLEPNLDEKSTPSELAAYAGEPLLARYLRKFEDQYRFEFTTE